MDALVRGGQAGRLGQLPEGAHGQDAAVKVQGRELAGRAHGLEDLRLDARFLVPGAQPLHHEGEDRVLAVASRGQGRPVGRQRPPNRRPQSQGQLSLDQDAHGSQGGAAQGVGVFLAGGRLADAEDARDGVQSVGQGENPAQRRRRDGVAREAGAVLLADGLRHLRRFAAAAGVIPARDPLQFREFSHQLAQQIAFAQFAGSARRRRGRAQRLRHPAGQVGQPRAFVAHGAQFFVKDEPPQTLAVIRQRPRPVAPPEELGVAEPGHDDLLVAAADGRGIRGGDVEHGQERGHQPAPRPEDGEEALLFLHDADQQFFRELEVALGETAGEHRRPLHQGGHFFQQRFGQHVGPPPQLRDGGGQQFPDPFPAGPVVRAYAAGLGQQARIVRGAGQFDGAGMMEAVAVAATARAQAEYLGCERGLAEQQRHPAHGAREFGLPRPPAHGPRQRQPRQRLPDQGREQLRGGLRRLPGTEHQALGLLVNLQRLGSDAAGPGEAAGGGGKAPLFVVGGGEGGAAAQRLRAGAFAGHAGDQDGQAARGGVPAAVAVGQVPLPQPGLRLRGEPAGQLPQGGGRQFLRADLQQQVRGLGAGGLGAGGLEARHGGDGTGGGSAAAFQAAAPPSLPSRGKPRASRERRCVLATVCANCLISRIKRCRSVTDRARQASRRLNRCEARTTAW